MSGKQIEEDIFSVTSVRDSVLQWSRQVRPSLSDRKIWEKYLKRLCFNSNELIATLGRWIAPSHQLWKYMLTADKKTLLRLSNEGQRKLRKIGNNLFIKIGERCEMMGGYPIHCRVTGIGYKVEPEAMVECERETIGTNDFDPFALNLTKTLGHVTCTDKRSLRRRWKAGSKWKCATDGGLKNGVGTSGVVLWEQSSEQEMCSAKSAETCPLGLLHSTREELRALLSAEILIAMCNNLFGSKKKNEVEFICDSKSAIAAVTNEVKEMKESSPLKAEMEVIMEIERLKVENKSVDRNYKWIKSHQENEEPTVNEMLNARADEIATEHRSEVATGHASSNEKQFYAGAKAVLQVGGVIVNKDYKGVILRALFADELREYLKNKYEWNDRVWDTIDWNIMEAPLGKLKGQRKVTIYKLVHLWQPTDRYKMRNEDGLGSEGKCTHCGEIDEQLHYMRCKNEYFKDARTYAWKRFCEKMKAYRREETFFRVIWIGLQNWIYEDFNEELPKGDEITDEEYRALRRAFCDQERIGWDHFLVGRMAKGWREYFEMRSVESPIREGRGIAFGRKLVESIWIYTLQVWRWHNESVHGKRGGYSKCDEEDVRKCVCEIYNEKNRIISDEEAWLFEKSVRIRESQPIPQILGWIERVLVGVNVDEVGNNPILCRAQQVLQRVCVACSYK